MKELTKAEEQVMQILWQMKKGFVKEILEEFPEPKPAYNTVSTIVRILERKEFIGHNAFGKSHQYFPLVSKPEYTKSFLNGFLSNYFSDSYKQLVSFFSKDGNLSISEMEEIQQMIADQIELKKEEQSE